ncbi:VOC family protein [Rhabdothermincola salaria]|uniref:VOC family protein n=1 Tax=Rhabdothermincola salaria TaxID=2903142 RepID=UPI001E31574F|nr:VOC family protein [Rhabdothermincola salaria]MCD9624264.1 VOC family protein [Rhabdothermincola salaria]
MSDTHGLTAGRPPLLFQQDWPEGEYRFFQLGFIVDDVVAAARRWSESFGVGPFYVQRIHDAPCTYRGAPSAVSMELAVAQAGPVQIELIAQLCDRGSVYRELELAGRATFHQVCTLVDDYDETLDGYRSKGLEIACEFLVDGAPPVAYVDTVAEFGFFTEVAGRTDSFVAHLTQVAEAGRTWDGSDPVREATSDGYRAIS